MGVQPLNAEQTVVVLTPVHNESGNLPRYVEALERVLLHHPNVSINVLLVDDGSSDSSWPFIHELCQRDNRFRGIRLSRNFGPHAAIRAGLHHADGDAVVILACDLQDPPEVIHSMIERWQAGAKIVWGKRRSRADGSIRTWGSRFFEWALRRFAMPRGSQFTTGSFLLMDRKVLECYRQFHEGNRVTFALVAYTGFPQAVVEYDRAARQAGRSSWRLRALIRAAVDTFLSFSRIPFGAITFLGLLLFLLCIPASVYLILCYVLGNPMPGWTSMMLVQVVFFALQCVLMSFLGEYVSRIYAEVVRRPTHFISERTEDSKDAEPF